MGLKFSSFVANAAFMGHSEVNGLKLLDPMSCDVYSIKTYLRYADNLLFICRNEFDRIRQLRDAVIDNAPYSATIEETGVNGVAFLDLQLSKDQQWSRDGRISIAPFLKDSSLKTVLLHNSCHPSSVHGSWTVAYIQRMFKHSSDIEVARSFKTEVLNRMRSAGIDQSLLQHIDEQTRRTFRCSVPCIEIEQTQPVAKSRFWIPLPYHPVYKSAIGQALHRFNLNSSIQELCRHSFGRGMNFGVAWKLDSLPLVSVYRKH